MPVKKYMCMQPPSVDLSKLTEEERKLYHKFGRLPKLRPKPKESNVPLWGCTSRTYLPLEARPAQIYRARKLAANVQI